jgi:hypothetical protein
MSLHAAQPCQSNHHIGHCGTRAGPGGRGARSTEGRRGWGRTIVAPGLAMAVLGTEIVLVLRYYASIIGAVFVFGPICRSRSQRVRPASDERCRCESASRGGSNR